MISVSKLQSRYSLYAMVMLYLLAGLNHFLNPDVYMNVMPAWLCCHASLVLFSGVCEVLLALLLLVLKTRKIAAWCIILLLILVFPANIQFFINQLNSSHPMVWLAVLRLPLQFVLVWWAYAFTKSPGAVT